VINGEDLDKVVSDPIYDAIVAENDFAESGVLRFGDDPSGTRKVDEALNRGECVSHEEAGVVRRTAAMNSAMASRSSAA